MKVKNCLIGFVFSVFAATSLAASGGLTGQPAPDFALKSSTGENLRLSEYRGDVVRINFWATWCGPCRQEMPLLDELYSRYQRVGFSLLGVNIDDDSRKAMNMVSELGVSFPVLFDARKEVSKLYDVDAAFDDHDHEWYEVDDDPHELVNLAHDRGRRGELRELHARLLEYEAAEFG